MSDTRIDKFDTEFTKLVTRCLEMYPEGSTQAEYVQLKNFRDIYDAKKDRAKAKDIMDVKGLAGAAAFLPLFERFIAKYKNEICKLDMDDRWLRNSQVTLRFVDLIPGASEADKSKYTKHTIRLSDLYLRAHDVRNDAEDELSASGVPPERAAQDSRLRQPYIFMMYFMRILYLASGGDPLIAKVLAYHENAVNPRERMVPAAATTPSNPFQGGLSGILDAFATVGNGLIKMGKDSGISGFDAVPELSKEKLTETFGQINPQALTQGIGKVITAFNSGGDIQGTIKEIIPDIQSTMGQLKGSLESLGIPVDQVPSEIPWLPVPGSLPSSSSAPPSVGQIPNE
jgi:hypothetical protein